MGRTDHNIQRHCKNGKSTQHSGSVIVPIFSCRQSEGTPVSLPSGRFGIAEFVFTLAPFPISGIRRVREFLPGNFPPSLKGMYLSASWKHRNRLEAYHSLSKYLSFLHGTRFATRLLLRENGLMVQRLVSPVILISSGSPGGCSCQSHSGTDGWTSSAKNHLKYILYLVPGIIVIFSSLLFFSFPRSLPPLSSTEIKSTPLIQHLSGSSGQMAPDLPDPLITPFSKAQDMLDCRHLDLAGVTSWICDHPVSFHPSLSAMSASALPEAFRFPAGSRTGQNIRPFSGYQEVPVLVSAPPPKPSLLVRFASELH